MQTLQLIDTSNTVSMIKRFYSDENGEIILFHDSIDVIVPLYEAGVLNERSAVVLTESWYVKPGKAATYKRVIDAAQASVGTRFSVAKQIVIVADSDEEKLNLRKVLPDDIEIIVANHTFFIDTEMFKIDAIEKCWLCVFNAKQYAFKRLHLSALVHNKVFITYENAHEASEGELDRVRLEDYGESTIYKSISSKKVAEILNQTQVGAILSEEEGACNASTEYLLCGLPVVSTPSRGGRDAFYDEHTAVICEPTAESVERAVSVAADKLRSGEFSPVQIRERTLKRIEDCRNVFIESLERQAKRLGIQASMRNHFRDFIRDDAKLLKHRNLFIKEVRRSAG